MFSVLVVLLLALSSVHGGITIPEQIKSSTDLGKMELDRKLDFSVVLSLNNEAELDSMLQQVYDPKSPNYQKYLTPEEYITKYCPTTAQVVQITSSLQSAGIQVTSISKNRLILHASGNVGAVNSLLQTEMHYYSQNGNAHFAPSIELTIPTGIKGIHGLNTFSTMSHHLRKGKFLGNATNGGTHSPFVEKPHLLDGYFCPSDINKAYNIPPSLNGAGQWLALFELDGYTASDIAGYCSYFGIPAVPLYNVYIDGVTGAPGDGADEVTLDIELMNAIAPGAGYIIVFEGPNDEQGILDTYNEIAITNWCSQGSSSWGAPEGTFPSSFYSSEAVIFKQIALQGTSFFVAAGDNGAYDNGDTLSVDDPASQPWVTGVGGTKLTVNSATSAWVSETSWNELSSGAGAGGGGISSIWSQPTYQNGFGTKTNEGSSNKRMVPDVSLNADPYTGYVIAIWGGLYAFGGTSCAAPLWAGFTALVNEQRMINGAKVLGFANPSLYVIGGETTSHRGYHDISDGSNNGYYPAVKGYDLSTGWGSFNGMTLLQSLAMPYTGVWLMNYGPSTWSMVPGESIYINTAFSS
jgi:kumamolisin